MRIGCTILGSLFKIGGYQVFTYNLLSQLSERGHYVKLYVTKSEYLENELLYSSLSFDVGPVDYLHPYLTRFAPYLCRKQMLKVQKRDQMDVWQIVGAYPAGYLSSSLSNEAPIVLRTHGEDLQIDAELGYGLRLDPSINRRVINTLKAFNKVIAMTRSMSETYESLGVKKEHIETIPNGVDYSRLSVTSNDEKTIAREKLGVELDIPLLLTVGRHHPKKGYELIPLIAKRVKEQGITFKWLVIGNNVGRIAELIQKNDVGDSVKLMEEIKPPFDQQNFLLPSQQLVDIYQTADLFVFPSFIEGFPRVIIEAMAASLPIITTDADGCREVVDNYITGLISEKGNDSIMAANIIKMLCDDELRQRLSLGAMEYAKAYDWPHIVDKYENLYLSLTDSDHSN